MNVLFDDDDFDAQLQRTVAHAYERGADLGEAVAVASRIRDGDEESWYAEWATAATAARTAAEESYAAGRSQSASEAFLRACEYYRQAMFYLRGDLGDERLHRSYRSMRQCFRRAAELLPFPVESVAIPYDGAVLNGYFMLPDESLAARATVLYPVGGDSPAEDGYLFAFPALRRGYAVLSFEGPGQGGVLYEQRCYSRPDYESVLSPVVDFALARAEVDGGRLGLVGHSCAGYLAPRAAAFEHRLAALVCDPGQLDLGARVRAMVPCHLLEMIEANDPGADDLLDPQLASTEGRRLLAPRMAAHGTPTVREYLRSLLGFSFAGMVDSIRCPTLLTDAEGSRMGDQSEALFTALRCPKQRRSFPAAEGAGIRCGGLGQQLWNACAFDWLDATFRL